jgi:hypothetical protein
MFQVIANLIRYVLNWDLFRTIFHTIFFVLLPLNYLALSGHLSLFAYLPEILLDDASVLGIMDLDVSSTIQRRQMTAFSAPSG